MNAPLRVPTNTRTPLFLSVIRAPLCVSRTAGVKIDSLKKIIAYTRPSMGVARHDFCQISILDCQIETSPRLKLTGMFPVQLLPWRIVLQFNRLQQFAP